MAELLNKCRLCLSEDVDGESIFEKCDQDGISLHTKIIICTSLMISPNDEFSKSICHQCTNMIDVFFEFKNACLRAYASAHQLIHTPALSTDFLQLVDNEKDEVDLEMGPLGTDCQEKLEDDLPVNCGMDIVGEEVAVFNTDIKAERGTDLIEDPLGNIESEKEKCYICALCRAEYETLEEIKQHWLLCSSGSQEVQLDSGQNGNLVNANDTNMITTKNAEFNCILCGKIFKQQSLLERHIKAIHIGVRSFNCSRCPRSFFDKYELKYHQRLHEDVDNYCCNVCGRRFARQSGLKSHMRRHTGEKPFKCGHCGKTFAYSSSLQVHERVHTGERPYACGFCDRVFSQYSAVKKHERTHLGGEKMFQCDVCDRMYMTDEELKKHLETHTGSNLKCSICDKGFRKQFDLSRHMLRIHSETKPYNCSSCTKSFVTLSELGSHMTSHTGELPFKCSICGKGYRLKTTLKNHISNSHPHLDNYS